ncbi:hypothetical protein CGI00_13210 [Vibrio parahaemolyticus]|nr:hypothetical protein CGI00_13210 [Vibrio parahaemolyticus]TOL46779.1 hypothetical protein CGH97_19365 [Vibrio parahaemolyticus]
MSCFRTKLDLGNKTRQHTYGLKKQLAQEPRNNNLNMLICSVQFFPEKELVRLSLSLGFIKTS